MQQSNFYFRSLFATQDSKLLPKKLKVEYFAGVVKVFYFSNDKIVIGNVKVAATYASKLNMCNL